MTRIIVSFIVVYIVFSVGCSGAVSENDNRWSTSSTAPEPAPTPTKPPLPAELRNALAVELCNRLGEIKKIPYRDPTDTDPIYEALIAKGEEAIPCLIEKISNASLMPDPREAPIWRHYAVGDTAVFILIRILREDDLEGENLLIEMLPSKYQDEWKTNGVYAYFNYVSEPENRKELQRWWRTWLDNNKK